GNFARTTIMYCFWKTQGMTVQPWRADIQPGVAKTGDDLAISIQTQHPWSGKLKFDTKRHQTILNLPFDWPRINQFPEWFTPDPDSKYELINVASGASNIYSGTQLMEGIDVDLEPGTAQWLLKAAS
ncbi:MAG: hypothetical protein RLQ12_02125, partial [Cyclobacteriaceae bacterium]